MLEKKMDEEKVKEAIEKVKMFPMWNTDDLWIDVDEMEELTDIIIEALKKQLPEKLIEHHYEDPGEEPYIKYGCPNGCKIQPSRRSNYCSICGQRLDWSE